jgi:hypothetical protein
MSILKALTVWQPWASLIMIEAKPYEFRGWNFAARPQLAGLVDQRIVIHAGARPVRRDEVADLLLRLRSDEAWSMGLIVEPAIALLERVHQSPAMLPLSSGLGTVRLGRPVIATAVTSEFGAPPNDSHRHDDANWAWPVRDVERFDHPRPASGAQGFWNWRDRT